MTSLDMAGISLTLLAVDDELLRLMDAPTGAPGWVAAAAAAGGAPPALPSEKGRIPVPSMAPGGTGDGGEAMAGAGVVIAAEQAAKLGRCAAAAAGALAAAAESLDQLDQAAGDGDCGSTLRAGAQAVGAALAAGKVPTDRPVAALAAIASEVRHGLPVVGGQEWEAPQPR